MVNVHVAQVDRKVLMRLKSWETQRPVVLGGESLPAEAGVILPGLTRALCIAPGEWLLISRDSEAAYVRERIEPELPAQGLTLVDFSDAYAAVHVRGPFAG